MNIYNVRQLLSNLLIFIVDVKVCDVCHVLQCVL